MIHPYVGSSYADAYVKDGLVDTVSPKRIAVFPLAKDYHCIGLLHASQYAAVMMTASKHVEVGFCQIGV